MLSRLWHSDNQSFNPRSPRGGATLDIIRKAVRHAVSIHAPHEGERRAISINYIFHIVCFNPRSPRGGATGLTLEAGALCVMFQSTLPTRGSDGDIPPKGERTPAFQSTLPTRGSDRMACGQLRTGRGFNPRSPRGGATSHRISLRRP